MNPVTKDTETEVPEDTPVSTGVPELDEAIRAAQKSWEDGGKKKFRHAIYSGGVK